MASVNTLIKKGYLLAGVIIAANMFIVNEVRATDNTEEKEKDDILNTDEKDKEFSIINVLLNSSGPVLYWENTINLAVGFVFSSVNNYFRWWNYNAGGYRKLGCFGWRSGRFLKDYLQFEINLNVGRGIFWLIPTIFGSCQYLKGKISIAELKSTAAVIMASVIEGTWENDTSGKILFFFLSCVQGFVSMPLTIHISNFSIAISLDSILWELVTIVRKDKAFSSTLSYANINAKNNNNNTNELTSFDIIK